MWWRLLIWVITTILTDIMTKVPPDAVAAGVGDFSIPTATEGRVVSICLGGNIRINAPNCIWYGDYAAIERIQTTGVIIKKDQVIGYTYELALAYALLKGQCAGITKMWIGDEPVFDHVTDNGGVPATVFDVERDDLFGGKNQGGGFTGRIRLFDGDEQQAASSFMSSRITEGVPAYRGTSYIVVTDLLETKGADIGEAPNLRYFNFEVQMWDTVANGGLGDALGLGNDHHFIGDDANPISIAYDLFINDRWGRGLPVSDVNLAQFKAAAETIWTEGIGFSMLIDEFTNTEQIQDYIEQHCDCYIGPNAVTGQFEVNLARPDYVLGDQYQANESNVVGVKTWNKGDWSQTFNRVRMRFADRAKDWDETHAVANAPSNRIIQGRLKSQEVRYPGVHAAFVANKIVAREKKNLARPARSGTIELNRTAWQLRPGQVFSFTSPTVEETDLPVRITKTEIGDPIRNTLVCEVVEDIFDNETPTVADPPDTDFVPPIQSVDPFLAADQFAIEAPFMMIRQDPTAPNVKGRLMTGARLNTGAPTEYEIIIRDPGGSGSYVSSTFITGGFMTVGTLRNNEVGLLSGNGGKTLQVDPVAGSLDALIAEQNPSTGNMTGVAVIDPGGANEEWVVFTGIVDDLTGIRLEGVYRGGLDTSQYTHSIGDRIWFIWTGGMGLTDQTFALSATPDAKLLPRSPNDAVLEGDATAIPLIPFQGSRTRYDNPLLPRGIWLNGTEFANVFSFNTVLDGGPTETIGGRIVAALRDWRNQDPLTQVQGVGIRGDIWGDDEHEVQYWLYNLLTDPSPTRGVAVVNQSVAAEFVSDGGFDILKADVEAEFIAAQLNSLPMRLEVETSHIVGAGRVVSRGVHLFDFTGTGVFLTTFDSVYLHLDFELGVQGETRTRDISANQHHVEMTGNNATVDLTSNPPVGTRAMAFDWVSPYVNSSPYMSSYYWIPPTGRASGRLDLNQDFTLECRLKFLDGDVPTTQNIFGQHGGTTLGVTYTARWGFDYDANSNRFEFKYSTGGGWLVINFDEAGGFVPLTAVDFTALFDVTTDINASTDEITETAHGLPSGARCTYTKNGGSAVIGLTEGATYYVGRVDDNRLLVYLNEADALAGVNRISLSAPAGGEDHSLIPDVWYAIMLTRQEQPDGTFTFRLFRDGVLVSTQNVAAFTITSAGNDGPISIGAGDVHRTLASSATQDGFRGYMDEARIIQGIAVELIDYTVDDTAPLAYERTAAQMTFAQTQFRGEAGLDTVNLAEDLASSTLIWAYDLANANCHISSVKSKWWNTSLYIDGTNDAGLAWGVDNVTETGHQKLKALDFTIEGWVNFDALPSTKTSGMAMCGDGDNGGNERAWFFGLDENDELEFSYWDHNVEAVEVNIKATTTPVVAIDTWYHLAVCRSGVALEAWFNGTRVLNDATFFEDAGNNPVTINGAETSGALAVGKAMRDEAGDLWRSMDGYVDSVRMMKNIALYTGATITVPTEPFEPPNPLTAGRFISKFEDIWYHNHFNWEDDTLDGYWVHVAANLAFEGTDLDTTTTDDAYSNRTWTFQGAAEIDNAQANTGSTSLLLDGVDSYIDTPHHNDFDIMDGRFTIEAAVRFANTPAGGGDMTIVSKWGVSNLRSWHLWFADTSSDRLAFSYSVAGTTFLTLYANWSPAVDTWYDVCVVSDGTGGAFYIDGVMITAFTTDITTADETGTPVRIGWSGDTGDDQYFDGWIDDVRITTEPRYPITVASSLGNPLPTNPRGIKYGLENAECHDSTERLPIVAHTGAPVIDHSQFKFGNASLYLDGSSYVQIDSDAPLLSSAQAFMFEAQVMFDGDPGVGNATFMSAWNTTGSDEEWLLALRNDELVFLFNDGAVTTTLSGAWNPATATWYHVCVTKVQGVYRIFADGVLLDTFQSTATARMPDSTAEPTRLGTHLVANVATDNFTGWIDEVRMLVSDDIFGNDYPIANFTAPTTEYDYHRCVQHWEPQSRDSLHGGYVENKSYKPMTFAFQDVAAILIDGREQHGARKFATVDELRGGGNSAYITCSGNSHLSTNIIDDHHLLNGDFTFEGWFNFDDNPLTVTQCFASHNEGTTRISYFFRVNATLDALEFGWTNDGPVAGQKSVYADWGGATTGVWYHLAVSREGDTLRLFIDGVLQTLNVGSDTLGADEMIYKNVNDFPTWFAYDGDFAGANPSQEFDGEAFDCRWSRKAIYTATFTPPAMHLRQFGSLLDF